MVQLKIHDGRVRVLDINNLNYYDTKFEMGDGKGRLCFPLVPNDAAVEKYNLLLKKMMLDITRITIGGDLKRLGSKHFNCRIDDECVEYGECCVDARSYNVEQQTLPERYKFVNFRKYINFYMRGGCLEGWQDVETARLCQEAQEGSLAHISSSSDLMVHHPVTSNTTFITHNNYYCAICNNDSSSVKFWNAPVMCPYLLSRAKEYIMSNITFINDSWRVYFRVGDITEPLSYPCNITLFYSRHCKIM